MAVKLIAQTAIDKFKRKTLDVIEFRFSSGLSLFTDTFIGIKPEVKKRLHLEFRLAVEELHNAGIETEYDLNGLKAF